MRHVLQLTAMIATAGFLLATSQARTPCATETINLRADTTCGPPANVQVASVASCNVTATGADFGGLPTSGSINQSAADAGVGSGFQLVGMTADGGNVVRCNATPADGGFDIVCTPTCGELDGGPCEASCKGTLTPQ